MKRWIKLKKNSSLLMSSAETSPAGAQHPLLPPYPHPETSLLSLFPVPALFSPLLLPLLSLSFLWYFQPGFNLDGVL